jgi:two-component system response regulator MprA
MNSNRQTNANRKPLTLIVDDEPQIVEFLKMGFGYEGFSVSVALDGAEAMRLALAERPDIIILDIMLPGLSGLEVAKQLRQKKCDSGIIMLTAREGVDERIEGLDTGADDYLTKPFSFAELLARVRAVLRRRGNNVDRFLAFEDVTMDRETRTVTRGDRSIELTPREFELLELFLMHPRQVLTRDTILTRIWGYDYMGDDNIIEVFVRHLREKLGEGLIQTVRGVGYTLRG